MKVQLGDKVRDNITGFEGVLTGWVAYLTGCEQGLVQPPWKPDGDFVKSNWFDEDRLEKVEANVHEHVVTKAGACDPAPTK